MGERKLQSLLEDVRGKHGVVGASLGILKDGAIESCASGLLNLDTQVECTPDSVFQIGSIGKIFTTTLIMQLLDQGRLNLDGAVRDYVPDFTLADPAAARTVTVRQLLNHTCGIDGDFFPPDDPEGPSTLSYVRKMCLLTNLYPPGKGPMTYSNSGFVVAGRIIEVLTGMIWQDAVMKRICEPLLMPAAFAHPTESLRFRCAIGHIPDPKDPKKLVLSSQPFLPLSVASAGSALTMSPASLLIFAAAHMADGEYNGVRILSAESARRMRDETVPVPAFTGRGVTGRGLGWTIAEGVGYRMVGHDGGTRGQFAYLRTFPKQKIAFTLLTNSPSDKMFRDIEQHLMQSLLGTSVPADPPAETFEVQRDRYVGRYRNAAATYTVGNENGKLTFHYASPLGVTHEVHGALAPYRLDTFEIQESNSPFDSQKVVFLDKNKDGRAVFIRLGSRMGLREA